MAKKKLITKVVSCLVVIVIVMSTVPGTVFASEPIPTRIHLQDATFEWNTTQSLVAKLVDEKNVPLSEKEIWFYVGTPDGLNKLGSSITNESGTAKYDIVVTMPDGEYLFNATFNGDINIYAPSSDTAVIAVVGDIAIADDVVIGLLIIGYLATLAIPLVVEIYKQQKWHAREDTQILEQDLNVWESRAVSAPIGGYSEDYYDAQDKINDYQVREVTSAMSTYSKAVDIMTRDSIDVMLDQYKQDAELGKKLRYEGEKLYSLGKTEEERKRGAQIYVVGTKLSLEVSKKTKELLEVKESSKVCGGPYITDFHIDVTPGKAWYSPSETTKVIIDVINDRNQKTNIWLGVSFKDPNGESAKYDPQITITPQSADIDQDTMKTFKAEWTIPADAPIGPYEVAVNCWKDNTFADKYTDDLGWQPIFYCPDFHIVVIPEETWYQPDETSKIKIDVTNNRNQKTNIWLGVSFKDPNGESAKYDPQITITPQSVELNPSETKTFTVEWTPVDAPIGPYEVAVNCWKDNTFTDKYIDDFRWKLIFHCYKLDIVSPTTASPTIVGDPTNPVGFPAKVSTGLRFLNVPGVFSAKIGNKPAKITVAKDDGKGNYVLQITPPIQDTEGSYDLNISVNARKISDYDIEPNAVVYSTGGNIDVVDVIDRSGSMEGEKIQAAKDSAKLFVDLMRVNDLIGVVSHDKTATVNYGLTTITSNSVKQNAKNAIDAISAGGGTSIGSGLRAAYNELVNKGNPTHQRAIVLLSDGKHKSPPHPEDVLPDIRKANIRVFTIGLGADANASLLSHIAHDSGGGEYYYSPGSEELRAIYNAIAGVIKAESTVKTVSGSIQKGETITQKVDIDSTINIATFTLTWASGTLNLELERPNGLKVSPSDFDLLSHTKGTTYETYTISDPIDGEWIMRFTAPIISSSNIGTAKGNLTVFKTLSSMNETNVTGDNSFTVIATPSEVDDNISREITVLSFDTSNVKAAQAGISYTGTVTATTNLAVHMYTDKSKYSLNEPIKIIITLTKAGSPIIGADVNAVIERPDNVKESLWLYDDGKHDDGVALDGVYANYYTNTDVSGSYTLTAFASGTANTEDFTRETKKSVYVSGVSAGDISVTPLSWDIGTIRPGEDVISAFTVSSTSTKDETVMVSATDLTDGYGNVIASDNVISMPSTFAVPAGGSSVCYERICVPEDTKHGSYTGSVVLTSTANSVGMPVTLHVTKSHILPVSNLNTGESFSTIQAAIDDPDTKDRHTIIVNPGTYTENVDVNKQLTIRSTSGNPEETIVQAADSNDHVFDVSADYVNISGFTVKQVRSSSDYASAIVLVGVKDCEISGNNIDFSSHGIALVNSGNNLLKENTVKNAATGISLRDSSNYNIIQNNTLEMNNYGLFLYNLQHDIGSDENTITCNRIVNNYYCGIKLRKSNSNIIYLNDFINNPDNVYSYESTNIWNSPSKITYVYYNGNTHISYLGNYWDDYTKSDADGDGIGDTPYGINTDKDFYPLLMPVENYIKQPTITVDTTPPEVICPADVTVELETIVGTVVPLDATATDNCDPNPTIASNELNIYPPGTTIVTFTATDASGNSASCSTNVAVVDTTPPEITNVMVSSTIVSSGTPICISANVFDLDKVSLIRAFITKEGEQVATVFMLDPDGDGVYTGTWRTASYTEPGIYSIDISATDREGNEALVKAPEVEITSEATGSISIHSSPSGATIWLETPVGMFVGPAVKTPYTFTNVPVGTSTITLYLESYQDWSTKVMVRAGETTYVDATLTLISGHPLNSVHEKITNNEVDDSDPTIVQISNGDILVAFTNWLNGA